MKSKDAERWKIKIEKEKDRFDKYKCFMIVNRGDIPSNAKIMSTTWAMKQKASGQLRGRLNARGYEQLEGQHYYAHLIAATVTNPNTIRILLILMCMNPKWNAEIVNIEGAFLQGEFKNGEEMYIDVPDGMEKFYGSQKDVVLKLNVPIYGTKQAASCFYKQLVKKTKDRGYKRSKADPCLNFVWKHRWLAVSVSCIDNLLIIGKKVDIEQVKSDLNDAFVCNAEGELKEYVRNKIDFSCGKNGLGMVKFTQPVLVQKLENELFCQVRNCR